MIRSSRLAVGASAIALVVGAVSVRADSPNHHASSAVPAASASARGAESNVVHTGRAGVTEHHWRTVHVDERYVRDLGNGCDYVATVRGTVHDTLRTGSEVFDPRLTVDAHVECEHEVRGTAPIAHITGKAMTREQLEHRVETAGRVIAPSGHGECAYSPAFQVLHGEVLGHTVWQVCTVARGGGPRVTRHVSPRR